MAPLLRHPFGYVFNAYDPLLCVFTDDIATQTQLNSTSLLFPTERIVIRIPLEEHR